MFDLKIWRAVVERQQMKGLGCIFFATPEVRPEWMTMGLAQARFTGARAWRDWQLHLLQIKSLVCGVLLEPAFLPIDIGGCSASFWVCILHGPMHLQIPSEDDRHYTVAELHDPAGRVAFRRHPTENAGGKR
jgi:hypothetical protein